MKRKTKKKSTLSKRVTKLEKATRQNRPQLLFDDTTGTNASIWTTPTVVKIDAGTAGSNQERVIIKSVQLKGFVNLVVESSANIFYRIVLFTDKQNEDGAIPAWGDVYKSTTGTDAVLSLRNIGEQINEGQRFKIIYDKRFSLIKDTDATIRDSIMFDFFKKLNIKSTVATGYNWWEHGGLYMAFVGTGGETGSDFTYQIRTRFINQSQ